MKISFKVVVGILFGLLVSAIGLLGILSYQYHRDLNDTSFWLRHSYKVINQVDEISTLYKDIQLESVAFFIDNDTTLIPFYAHSKELLWERINSIRSLTSGQTTQQIRINSLESLFKGLISSADSVFTVGETENYSDIHLQDKVINNTIFRNRIRSIIQDIKNEENHLLDLREEENRKSIIVFNRTFYQLLGGICILLITTFFSVRYNFNKRIRSQQELKNAHELFFKLFHESPIGIVITASTDGMIMDCNRAYSELINYSREEIIGKTPVMLGTFDSEDHYNKIINAARDAGKVKDLELQLKPNGKNPIWASVSIQSISIQNKKCLLVALLDMTVHKQAEEEIKKALNTEINLNKMKSDFVTLASHEFRTPLSTILSSSFILGNYVLEENREIFTKHLGRIKTSVGNLTSLLDEILSVTKIEEDKVVPKPERLDVRGFLDHFLSSLNDFTKPDQKIIYNHAGYSDFFTDPVLLGNIVNSLVSNALKYSPENSTVHISSRVNGQLHIAVKDSGIGIPFEDQKHLFGRFYRASNAVATQGLGLGLYISKCYLDVLKGTIEIKSELNKGTEVKIILKDLSLENHSFY